MTISSLQYLNPNIEILNKLEALKNNVPNRFGIWNLKFRYCLEFRVSDLGLGAGGARA